MNDWLKIIQDKLLPPRCVFCDRPGCADLDLCRDCLAELPVNLHACRHCGENLPSAASRVCGRCLNRPPDFDVTAAPFLYQDGMRHLITQLKFQRRYQHARLLGRLLAAHLQSAAELPECIIPMPLHINRYRQRGFNQSLEIARHVGRGLQLPLVLHDCIRRRDTDQQSGLSAEARQRNVRQAFSIAGSPAYRHAAIIDDVLTTGATAGALALALKRNGVERVDVWVCARA